MSGTLWIFIDLLFPVAGLTMLVVLIATATPDPERALQRQPPSRGPDRKGRSRSRRRRGRSAI
ncbi:MAG: hypothetical protein ACREBP_01615 [Sphingomicrobium sp.]